MRNLSIKHKRTCHVNSTMINVKAVMFDICGEAKNLLSLALGHSTRTPLLGMRLLCSKNATKRLMLHK